MAEFPDGLIAKATSAADMVWLDRVSREVTAPPADHVDALVRAALAAVADDLTEGIRTAVARIDIHSPHTSLCHLLDDLHALIGEPTVEEPPC